MARHNLQQQFLPKRSRNASARRRETLLPPASRSRRPDERIAPLFACLHSHLCSADGTGKKKGLRIHPPHLEARVCAAEGVRLRQRFDFFFSASESAAWLSPARETSAANPNFPNGAMGELHLPTPHLPAPLQTVHSPDRIRVDTKLDEARRQVQQEREEDRKRRDSEQRKERVA